MPALTRQATLADVRSGAPVPLPHHPSSTAPATTAPAPAALSSNRPEGDIRPESDLKLNSGPSKTGRGTVAGEDCEETVTKGKTNTESAKQPKTTLTINTNTGTNPSAPGESDPLVLTPTPPNSPPPTTMTAPTSTTATPLPPKPERTSSEVSEVPTEPASPEPVYKPGPLVRQYLWQRSLPKRRRPLTDREHLAVLLQPGSDVKVRDYAYGAEAHQEIYFHSGGSEAGSKAGAATQDDLNGKKADNAKAFKKAFKEQDLQLNAWVNPAEALGNYETCLLTQAWKAYSKIRMADVHWLLVNGLVPRGDERRWDGPFWSMWDEYWASGGEDSGSLDDSDVEEGERTDDDNDEDEVEEDEASEATETLASSVTKKAHPTPYPGGVPQVWLEKPQTFADVFTFGAQDKYFTIYGGRQRVYYYLFWRDKDTKAEDLPPEARTFEDETAIFNPSHCETTERDARVGVAGSIVAYDTMYDHPIVRDVMVREGVTPPPLTAALPAPRPPLTYSMASTSTTEPPIVPMETDPLPSSSVSALSSLSCPAGTATATTSLEREGSRGEKRRAEEGDEPPSAPHRHSPSSSESGEDEEAGSRKKKRRTAH